MYSPRNEKIYYMDTPFYLEWGLKKGQKVGQHMVILSK